MMPNRSVLEKAFAAHQAGRLQEAIEGYHLVLKADPAQPDALNLLGVIHSQRKDYPAAIGWLLRAIEAKPKFVDAWLNLAKTFRSNDRLEEGVGACDTVIRLEPNHAEAHAMRARLLRRLREYAEAAAAAKKALSFRPGDLEMGKLLASSLASSRLHEEAEAMYQQLREQHPQDLAVANDLAMLWVDMGRREEAFILLESLANTDPPSVAACSNFANMLDREDQREQALALHRKALALDPLFYPGWVNYANTLKADGQLPLAREVLEKAVNLRPERAEARVNLAGLLMEADDEQAAFAQLLEGLRCSPRFADGWNNLGAMELACARPDQALRAYARALDIDAGVAAAQFGVAMAALIQGDFEQGWPAYEWRWLGASQAKPQERPRFQYPQWQGQPTDRSKDTLLLYHEQGFGDTVQFLRFIPGLEKRFARVVLVLQPPLMAVARTSLPAAIELISSEEGTQFVRHNKMHWHCPLGSLALALGIQNVSLIPGAGGYLKVPAGRTPPHRLVQAVSQAKAGGKPVVGLCWAGNPALAHDATRSVALAQWESLICQTDVQWVSLQRDRSPAEAALLAQWGVLDLADTLHDFGDTAALLQTLNLVIAVDTVVVHLAGALGVPCWLLNRYQSEWRWMLGTEKSVWYHSVRQFRQHRRHDWAPVLVDLGNALKALPAAP